MDSEENPYQEGKRAGAHPILVILVVIGGLWIFISMFVPNPKHRQGSVPDAGQAPSSVERDTSPVIFRVTATVPEMNAISVLVPREATHSQIVGLLNRFRDARLGQTLSQHLPATTPGHKLGPHAVAEIYIFSDAKYAVPEAVKVLARGAHAPGELYPQAIPFEEAMEQVKGHYRIDLNDTSHPDQASMGFADESGVHSRHYKKLF